MPQIGELVGRELDLDNAPDLPPLLEPYPCKNGKVAFFKASNEVQVGRVSR